MSDKTDQIARLRQELHERERRFLMEKYASLLLLQVEMDEAAAAADDSGGDGLDERTVESLQVAHHYAGTEVGAQIAADT